MEEVGIADAFDLAVTMAECGFSEDDINTILSLVGQKDAGPVLRWVGDNPLLEKMVQDIRESSQRISTLINAVKMYTHMDQAPEKTTASIHEGLTATLNILNHKIKNLQVEMVREFDETIPKIPLFVSEINQVWTNLLDNALDAVAGESNPSVGIKTTNNNKTVTTCIRDNGKGISPDIAGRIWEPFYTTKAKGKCTGLGLKLV